jgi:hypothetical protein
MAHLAVETLDNHFQVLQMAYLRWKRKHSEMPSD